MIKRIIIITAIFSLALVFAANTFGQNNKRKRAKAKVATPSTNNPPTEARVANPKPVATNLMKGHEGMQERNAASGNTTSKKRQVKPVWDDTDIVHRQARKRGVTHDSEFENWANRKRKITKTRRINK